MNTDTHTVKLNINTEVSTNLSVALEQIKRNYPAYYRAWKSMLTTYGKDEVNVYWRGTLGLMVFIEETSSLIDSPTNNPEFAASIKLKRVDKNKRFSLDNVTWSLSKVVAKNIESKIVDAGVSINNISATEFLNVQKVSSEFRRTEDKEARLEELFTKSMEGTISKKEELELEVLSKAVVAPVREVDSADIEEFYNKRWSDL